MLVEVGGLRLLTDPVLGRRVGLLRRVAAPADPAAVAAIDLVLVSHAHGDHLDVPSLRRVGTAVPALCPPAAAAFLWRHGFPSAREVTAGATVAFGGLEVEVVHARHDGRRWPRGPAAEAVGFLVRGEGAVYFAGDTDIEPEMAELAGRVDVALMPVWGWGPTLGPGHLDPQRAAEALALIRPRVAIPIHWGTLAPPLRWPGRTAPARPAEEFAAAAARLAPEVDVRVLEPGARTAVDAQPRFTR